MGATTHGLSAGPRAGAAAPSSTEARCGVQNFLAQRPAVSRSQSVGLCYWPSTLGACGGVLWTH